MLKNRNAINRRRTEQDINLFPRYVAEVEDRNNPVPGNTTYGSAPVDITNAESSIVRRARFDRKYLLIQNISGSSIYVSFGSQASPTGSIEIVAGGNYEPSVPPVDSINMIGSISAYQRVIITEG